MSIDVCRGLGISPLRLSISQADLAKHLATHYFFRFSFKFGTFFVQIYTRSERNRNVMTRIFENLFYHGNIAFPLASVILRPMTMETRCPKVIFPNYSKKKPAEGTLVPPLWGTRGKNVCFSRIICLRCCTRRNLRFHVETVNTLIKNSSRDDRPTIST